MMHGVMPLYEVSLLYYQKTTNNAVNADIYHVYLIIEAIPLIAYEIIKSYIIFA